MCTLAEPVRYAVRRLDAPVPARPIMPRHTPSLAKLTRPRLHGPVKRDRLFARLDDARNRAASILVAGPPGAGKTTLVASWLEARKLSGIWYQVDSGDTDLASFFHYLGQAAQRRCARATPRLPALTPEYLQNVPAFARRFFRELFRILPAGATLVLDNYQEIPGDHPFHGMVAEAMEEVPAGATMVVISRHDPPAPYARLLANERGQVIDWDDLKLTLEEATAIGASKLRDRIASLPALYHASGGWAAGLVLMLQNAERVGEQATAPLASKDALFRYFAQIVFDRATSEVQQLLLCTAILPKIPAPIAQALTGSDRAAATLEQLYRRRLFTHRHPGEPPTYEYHALFRQFLREQARGALGAEAHRGLMVRAAALLDANGHAEAAIELLLEAQSFDLARDAIVRQARPLLARGRWRTLQEWGAQLPVEVRNGSPWLLYWLGRSQLGVDTRAGRNLLQRSLEGFERDGQAAGEVLASCGVMESHWLEWSGYRALDPLIDRVLVLLKSAPDFGSDEMELRAFTLLLVAMSFRKPGSEQMDRVQERVMTLLRANLDDEVRVLAAAILVGHSLPALDLPLARRTIDAIGDLPENGTTSVLARMNWFIRLAYHRSQAGDQERALACLRRAQELAETDGLTVGLVNRAWWGVFVQLTGGNIAAALKWVRRLESAPTLAYPFQRAVLLNLQSVTALAQGDCARAAHAGRQAVAIAREDGPAWSIPYFTIPTIYALIDDGRLAEAREQMRTLHDFLQGTFIRAHDVEIDFAQAYCALRENGRGPAFLEALGVAMTRARREGYIFGWRMQFAAHRILLGEALRAGIEPSYLNEVIARFRMRPGAEADQHWPWHLRILTLGRFELILHGEPLAFGRKIPRRLVNLLKVLVALGGRDVPEQKLIEVLWEYEDGDEAHHALSVALHRLRKLLEDPQAIQVQDGRVSLDRSRVWVDAFQFEVALGGQLSKPSMPSAMSGDGVADTISDLYRGTFLPSDTDAPWSISTRERLRAAFIDFVSTRGAQLERDERWPEAAAWYQRGLAADDLSEAFYQGVMRCCMRLGRNAEGLSTFRRMRQMLSVTLGLRPSEASETLYRALQGR
jgi:LuxR family maltose regulon positive regulatory protein